MTNHSLYLQGRRRWMYRIHYIPEELNWHGHDCNGWIPWASVMNELENKVYLSMLAAYATERTFLACSWPTTNWLRYSTSYMWQMNKSQGLTCKHATPWYNTHLARRCNVRSKWIILFSPVFILLAIVAWLSANSSDCKSSAWAITGGPSHDAAFDPGCPYHVARWRN